jgi:hypothetical protein
MQTIDNQTKFIAITVMAAALLIEDVLKPADQQEKPSTAKLFQDSLTVVEDFISLFLTH